MSSVIKAAQYADKIFRTTPLVPSILYQHVADIELYNADIASPSIPTMDLMYLKYERLWSVSSLQGVQKWLALIRVCQDRYKHELTQSMTWDMFMKYIYTLFPKWIQLAEWMIPLITPAEYGDVATIEQVSFNEYVRHYNLSPYDFILHILEIVLFGFVVLEENIKALRLEPYIAHHLLIRTQ